MVRMGDRLPRDYVGENRCCPEVGVADNSKELGRFDPHKSWRPCWSGFDQQGRQDRRHKNGILGDLELSLPFFAARLFFDPRYFLGSGARLVLPSGPVGVFGPGKCDGNGASANAL